LLVAREVAMLVELSKMEQRYDAVLGVIRDGFTITEVAQKFGVSRESDLERGGQLAIGDKIEFIPSHICPVVISLTRSS
jgi:D-serine deaminase-like pyridoxal phosphate-dependent protein